MSASASHWPPSSSTSVVDSGCHVISTFNSALLPSVGTPSFSWFWGDHFTFLTPWSGTAALDLLALVSPLHVVVDMFFFCGNRTWRETIGHCTRTHKTVRILSVLDRFWQRRSQEDMMTYKDSLSEIPCSSLETQTKSHEMQTNWLTLSQKVIRTKCCTHDWKRSMAVPYIRTRQQKAWSPVTNRRYFRRHGCPWKCLRKWNTHSSLPWEWWLPRSRWAPSRALTRFWAVPFLLGNITSFALSLFWVDFRGVHRFQLLNVCNHNVTLPNSPAHRAYPKNNPSDTLFPNWWILDWSFAEIG